MKPAYHSLIQQAYTEFNARNIDAILPLMHTDVQWPNGWEGGYVHGHEAVRDYWTRQWAEINPHVDPLVFTERPDGTIEVDVHQVVKENSGALLFDGMVKHVYTIVEGLIKRMDIEKAEP